MFHIIHAAILLTKAIPLEGRVKYNLGVTLEEVSIVHLAGKAVGKNGESTRLRESGHVVVTSSLSTVSFRMCESCLASLGLGFPIFNVRA